MTGPKVNNGYCFPEIFNVPRGVIISEGSLAAAMTAKIESFRPNFALCKRLSMFSRHCGWLYQLISSFCPEEAVEFRLQFLFESV